MNRKRPEIPDVGNVGSPRPRNCKVMPTVVRGVRGVAGAVAVGHRGAGGGAATEAKGWELDPVCDAVSSPKEPLHSAPDGMQSRPRPNIQERPGTHCSSVPASLHGSNRFEHFPTEIETSQVPSTFSGTASDREWGTNITPAGRFPFHLAPGSDSTKQF